MKGTEQFQKAIKEYLDGRAGTDSLFAKAYAKEKKSIEGCVTYILNHVKESGCCGFTDDEVYSMAVHYYDEDNISEGKPIGCQVVVNHHVEQSVKQPVKQPEKKAGPVVAQSVEQKPDAEGGDSGCDSFQGSLDFEF